MRKRRALKLFLANFVLERLKTCLSVCLAKKYVEKDTGTVL